MINYHSVVLKLALRAPIPRVKIDDSLAAALQYHVDEFPRQDPLRGLSIQNTLKSSYFVAIAWAWAAVLGMVLLVPASALSHGLFGSVGPALLPGSAAVVFCISGTLAYIRVVASCNAILGEVFHEPAQGIGSDPLHRPLHFPGYRRQLESAEGVIPPKLAKRAIPPSGVKVLVLQSSAAVAALLASVVCLALLA